MWCFVFAALVGALGDGEDSESMTWESEMPETVTPTYPMSDAPLIAGAVCGALAGLMAIVMLSYYCCRKRRNGEPEVYARIKD